MKDQPRRIGEGTFALLIGALALLLTSGPRLYLQLFGPAGHVFLGEIWGVYDIPRYVLLTRQAAAGSWLLDNRLQGAPHTAYLLYTPYILLGHLLGWTGLGPLVLLEIGRWIAFPFALGASWLFIARALPAGQRALGYFAAVLAGGLGFLALGHPPTALGPLVALDITAPSFTVMNSLNMAPHVAISVGCLAIFGWGLLEAADGRRRGLLGALALGVVASFHGFVVPCALLAGGLFFLWRGRRREVFVLLLLGTLLAAPFGIYQFELSASDPSWRLIDYAELENLPSILLSRALLLPFIVAGGVLAVRDPARARGPALALCWAACALGFDLYPGFASSELHRTVEGSPVAYGVLAAGGLALLAARWRAYLIAAAMLGPILESVFLVAAGPLDSEAFMPASDYRLAARLDRAGDTRCVVGDQLTILWVVALSRTCDAEQNSDRVPPILRALSQAGSTAEARAALPEPDDLVVWGERESVYGPPPAVLRVLAKEGSSNLLTP